jgi:hypothetical protein
MGGYMFQPSTTGLAPCDCALPPRPVDGDALQRRRQWGCIYPSAPSSTLPFTELICSASSAPSSAPRLLYSSTLPFLSTVSRASSSPMTAKSPTPGAKWMRIRRWEKQGRGVLLHAGSTMAAAAGAPRRGYNSSSGPLLLLLHDNIDFFSIARLLLARHRGRVVGPTPATGGPRSLQIRRNPWGLVWQGGNGVEWAQNPTFWGTKPMHVRAPTPGPKAYLAAGELHFDQNQSPAIHVSLEPPHRTPGWETRRIALSWSSTLCSSRSSSARRRRNLSLAAPAASPTTPGRWAISSTSPPRLHILHHLIPFPFFSLLGFVGKCYTSLKQQNCSCRWRDSAGLCLFSFPSDWLAARTTFASLPNFFSFLRLACVSTGFLFSFFLPIFFFPSFLLAVFSSLLFFPSI